MLAVMYETRQVTSAGVLRAHTHQKYNKQHFEHETTETESYAECLDRFAVWCGVGKGITSGGGV